jgi:NAD-dependent dihydropyrimidine dehydrogenase PreA subunit
MMKIVVNEEECIGCGICSDMCPEDVLKVDEEEICRVVRPEDCTECKACEVNCEYEAIQCAD